MLVQISFERILNDQGASNFCYRAKLLSVPKPRAPIYGGFLRAKSLLPFWEAQMIKKHLEELETVGKVRRLGNSYFKITER